MNESLERQPSEQLITHLIDQYESGHFGATTSWAALEGLITAAWQASQSPVPATPPAELGFEVQRLSDDVLIKDSDESEWTSGTVWARSAPETIVTMLADLWEVHSGSIELLKRISTDIAQTIIEDPVRAVGGWAMMSQPVLRDIQKALYPYQSASAAVPCGTAETPAPQHSLASEPEKVSGGGTAEELARLRSTIDQVLCRRIKHIGDADQLYTGYPNQLIDELTSAVAALLRPHLERERQ